MLSNCFNIGYFTSFTLSFFLKDLIKLKDFTNFRNKEYSEKYPDKKFVHVQGGLFILNRKMIESIGGYNHDVPHNNMDVEYSYYAVSKNWDLIRIPEIASLTVKTLPGLSAFMNENIVAAHPVTVSKSSEYDLVVNSKKRICGVCGWTGKMFGNEGNLCPKCKSTPKERALYSFLADSDLIYKNILLFGCSEFSDYFKSLLGQMFNFSGIPFDKFNMNKYDIMLGLTFSEVSSIELVSDFKGKILFFADESDVSMSKIFDDKEYRFHYFGNSAMQSEFMLIVELSATEGADNL